MLRSFRLTQPLILMYRCVNIYTIHNPNDKHELRFYLHHGTFHGMVNCIQHAYFLFLCCFSGGIQHETCFPLCLLNSFFLLMYDTSM